LFRDSLTHARLKFKGFFVPLILFAAALSAGRLYFFIKYHDTYSGIDASSIAWAFVQGMRFDLSTAALMSAPVFLVLFFPGISLSRLLRRALLATLLAWYAALLAYNFIDIQYYSFAQRHLTFELSNTWRDTGVIVKIGLARYVPEFIALVLFIVLFGSVYIYLAREKKRSPLAAPGGYLASIAVDAGVFLAIAALTVVLARGGVQMKPLSIKNAFSSDRIEVGTLALNGIYSTFNTLYNNNEDKNLEILRRTSFEKEADVQGFIVDRSKEGAAEGYPLFRKFNYPDGERKNMNVVIFVMESWSAKFIGSLGGKVEAAPFFSSLSKDGMLLNNCFANAQRSYEGLSATLGSLPSWKKMSLDQGGLLYQTRLEPAVSSLKRYGYETIFVHGARPGSLGFDSLVKRFGFQRHISRDDFDDSGDDGTWGIYDEYTFQKADEEFSKTREPFFAAIFSLSSHTPYKLPSKEFEHFGSEVQYSAFLNSMRYSDHALRKFFEKARRSDYFKNTIFVIVGDHTEGHSTRESVYEGYRVPCLFYGPGVKPSVDQAVASQVDILPTVFDMLKVPAPFTSWGKSVLAEGERRALLPRGDMFVWVNGRYMLVTDMNAPMGLYDYKADPARDILKDGAESKALMEEFQQYLKFSYDLILSNKVRPPQ